LRSGGALRFAILGGAIVLASGFALLPQALSRGDDTLRWGALGWSIMAVTGLAGGVWMLRKHGGKGAGFLVALGTCMLARLFASVAGAAGAAMGGMEAVWPYVVGLAAGYLPLQLFELYWFIRRARLQAAGEVG
jgi:hypothetical protein